MSIPTYPLSPTSVHDRRLQRDRFAQAREKGARDQAYADLHHLTQLPDSIRHFPHKSYSTSAIEQALQSKINQHTSRDSDRFRQVLKLFKAQVERESESDDECLWITREQFGTVLSLLGLFATREQADELFDKYDLNGNGQLTVFEFLQRSRPKDYIGEHWAEPESTSLGKKQAHSRTGRGDPPRTPSESVYRLSVERLCNHLRQKLEINKSVGETSSRPRARRELSQLFEYYDKDGLNYVDAEGLRRVLENVNFILGSSHRTTLLSAFPGPKEATFDYPAFILHVYPDQPIQTSLYLTSDTLDVPRTVSPRASSPRVSSPRASSPRASASPRATTPRSSSLAIPSSSEGKRVSSPRAVSPRQQTTLPPLPQPVVAVTSQRAITPRGRGL